MDMLQNGRAWLAGHGLQCLNFDIDTGSPTGSFYVAGLPAGATGLLHLGGGARRSGDVIFNPRDQPMSLMAAR